MLSEKKILTSIPAFSKRINSETHLLIRELGGAKNYLCTLDLEYWTYGKSVVNANGAVARKRLQSIDFVDVLKLGTQKQKKIVIAAFKKWAAKVKDYPILKNLKPISKEVSALCFWFISRPLIRLTLKA